MIVADANLMVYLHVPTPQTPLAQRWAEIDPRWTMPPLCRYEFTQSIVGFVRAGALSRTEGEIAIANAVKTCSTNELPVDQTTVFRTAMRYRISAYDANYIALAEMLDTFCVTADQQMLERVPRLTRALTLGPPAESR